MELEVKFTLIYTDLSTRYCFLAVLVVSEIYAYASALRTGLPDRGLQYYPYIMNTSFLYLCFSLSFSNYCDIQYSVVVVLSEKLVFTWFSVELAELLGADEDDLRLG